VLTGARPSSRSVRQVDAAARQLRLAVQQRTDTALRAAVDPFRLLPLPLAGGSGGSSGPPVGGGSAGAGLLAQRGALYVVRGVDLNIRKEEERVL